MFKGLKKNGEETPLDQMPDMDFSYNWFMNAYNVLSHSSNESGLIPLSELKIYEQSFGLIGTFTEFVSIIYAMNDIYSEHRKAKNKKEIKKI
jgi:hypothetical protein